jgi:hypothetical protein
MLSKCANPQCTAPFHYLHEGKLFQIDTSLGAPQSSGPQLVERSKPPRHVEYFWLCGQCSLTMTLTFQRGKGVVTVPLQSSASQRATAS